MLLAAAIVAGHLVPGLDRTAIDFGMRNALHVVVFGIFSSIVYLQVKAKGRSVACIAALFLVAAVGLLGELLQLYTGRGMDPGDVGRDLYGAAVALLAITLWERSGAFPSRSIAQSAVRILAGLAAVAMLLPLVYWIAVIQMNRMVFPTIVDFDNWWDRHKLRPLNAEVSVQTGSDLHQLRTGRVRGIRLSDQSLSGLTIHLLTHDWSAFENLEIVAAIDAGTDLELRLRVYDSDGLRDRTLRYRKALRVSTEPTIFHIALDQMLIDGGPDAIDLADVQGILMFTRDRRDGTTLMLDSVRLR